MAKLSFQRRVRESGLSLLEQAVVLPFVVVFLVAAVDVTRVVQSYSALHQGVSSALRCVYPSDGGAQGEACTRVNAPSTSEFESVEGYPLYGPRTGYDATASWLNLPTYTFNPLARILDRGEARYNNFENRLMAETFPGAGIQAYIQEERWLPWLSGNNYSPTLRVGPNQRGRSYGTTAELRGSVSGSTTSSTPQSIGSVSFRIDPLNPSGYDPALHTDCLTSVRNNTTVCNEGINYFEGSTADVRIAYRITGSSQVSDPSAVGQTLISFSWGRNNKDQGGRVFSHTGRADFLTRGIPKLQNDNYDSYGEYDLYADVSLPIGKTINLDFDLLKLSGPGRVGWTMSTVELYVPEYTIVTNPNVRCHTAAGVPGTDPKLTRNEWAIKKECESTRTPSPVVRVQPLETEMQLRGVGSAACALNPIDKESFISTYGLPNGYIASDLVMSNQQNTGVCPLIKRSQTCSPNNFGSGATSIWDPETESHYVNGDQSTICGNSTNFPNPLEIDELRYYERDRSVTPREAFNFANRDCLFSKSSVNQSELPEDLRSYAKLDLGERVFVSRTKNCLEGLEDPAILKQQLRYSCNDVSVGSESRSWESFGPLGCDYEENLKEIARNENFNLGCFLKVQEPRELPGLVRVPFEELDECNRDDIQIMTGSEYEREREFLGFYEPGSEINRCKPFTDTSPSDWCAFESVGNLSTGGGAVEYNEELAEAIGLEAIQALAPGDQTNCEGARCPSISVSKIRDDSGRQSFIAEAEMEVPMQIMLNEPLKIRYADQETWEGEFSR